MAAVTDTDLLAPREILAALLNACADGVLCVDGARRIRMWSPALERLFGVTRAQAIGEPVAAALPFLAAAGEPDLLGRALGGEASATAHAHDVGSGGRVTHVRCRYVPLRDEGGSVRGALVVIQDATEEEALRRAAREVRPPPRPPVDPRIFDSEAAVGYAEGDADRVRHATGVFLEMAPSLLVALDVAVERQDRGALADSLARLKEAVVWLGGHRASWAAGDLERLIHGGDPGALSSAWTKLQAEVGWLCGALREWRETTAAPAARV